MKFCINQATTMETDYRTDIEAYAKAGFDAAEIWLPKVDKFLETGSLKDARAILDDNGVKAAGSCYYVGIMLPEDKAKALDGLKKRLDLAAALGAPMIVVPTDFPASVKIEDYDRAVPNIRKAGEVAKSCGVKLGIEFIRAAKFIGTLSTTNLLVRKVKHPYVGVLIDTFHFYCGLSQMPDLLTTTGKDVLLVHINDCADKPREVAEDSDRVLLGKGVFPLVEMVRTLKNIGFNGYYSLELFDKSLWAEDPKVVAKKAFHNLQSFFAKV